jgi:hypothetical protein
MNNLGFSLVSALHETTGFTPNYLMLCREVSTPIDIMYEIPPNVKTFPKKVLLNLSTIPSDCGWYAVVLVFLMLSILHISLNKLLSN